MCVCGQDYVNNAGNLQGNVDSKHRSIIYFLSFKLTDESRLGVWEGGNGGGEMGYSKSSIVVIQQWPFLFTNIRP